ncbi:MAG: twin-arginine translocase subunit TatC [Pseudomonadota bacterium]
MIRPKAEDDWRAEIPLIAHLRELRTRLLKTIYAVLGIFLCLIWFANPIYSFLSEPLRRHLPDGATMIATDVASPFLTPFKMVLVLSVFLAMPVFLHQAWCFISRGLYNREQGFAVPLLITSVLLFYLGVVFAYFVVFPLVFAFFTGVGPDDVTVMTDISQYLGFIIKLFFAFGIAFEIPIVTLLLVWSGFTTTEMLRKRRAYVVLVCFIVGMLLTPPDVISQTLLALPMWALFETGIFFAAMMDRKPNVQQPMSS